MQLERGDPRRRESGRCPVSAIGGEFNPFVDPYLADPYPFWLRARRSEPIFYSPELHYWVVTRYDDIKAIFADPESFSAGNAQNPITPLDPEVVEILRTGLKTKPTMSNADPPVHTRIRKSTWTAFSPKRVAQLEPEVRRIVTRYLDRVQSARSADLVHEMFYDLPVLVLFLFLGMPEADVARVKSWSRNRLLLTWGRLSREQQMIEARGLLEYWKYTEAFVAAQAAHPPDNYVGDLIRVSQRDESELSLHEVTNVVYGLLLAGHETTTSMSSTRS